MVKLNKSVIFNLFSLTRFTDQENLTNSSSEFSEKIRTLIVLCFHLLFAVVPFFFLTVNEELFEFNKMILTYFITCFILGLWMTRVVLEKRNAFAQTPLDVPIVLFVISQIISTVLSIHPRTSWFGYYTRFNGGLLSTLTYTVLFYAYVSNVRLKDQTRLLWTALIAGFGIALYAIPEHFGYSLSCLVITGEFNASCWVQDVQTRVFASFGQPNWLAAYVIMLFPLSVFFSWKHTQKKIYQLSAITFSLAFFLTLLFTKSRSGFLGWALGTGIFIVGILFLFFENRKYLKKKLTPTTSHPSPISYFLLPISCLLFIPLLFSLIFGTPFSPSLAELTNNQSNTLSPNPQTLTSNIDRLEQGGTDSGEIRKIVWAGALNVWKRYPVFGSGVETFAYSYYQDRPVEHNTVSEWNFLYNKAHNEWLNFLATSGAVGLTTYLFLQGFVILLLLKIFLTSEEDNPKMFVLAILSGLISVHVSNFFGFSTVMINILMWLFPAFALVSLSNTPLHTKYHILNTSLNRFQILTTILISLIIVLFLSRALMMWVADYYYARAKTAYSDGQLQTAFDEIKLSMLLSPNEGIFHELNAKINLQATIALADSGQPEKASETATTAVDEINQAILLNPVHLNFYRTQSLIFITLAQFEPSFYDAALQALEMAQQLAPTEPKLVYDMGVIYDTTDATAEAELRYKKAIELKPNFDTARFTLGKLLERQGKFQDAKNQYQYILENINPNNTDVKNRLDFVATQEAKKK